jgi:hypothetical protein
MTTLKIASFNFEWMLSIFGGHRIFKIRHDSPLIETFREQRFSEEHSLTKSAI